MTKPSLVILLAEGKRDQRFVWRYLREAGFEPHQVDEGTDYHNRQLDDLIPPAAAKFHEWTTTRPAACLPSLLTALEETRRLS